MAIVTEAIHTGEYLLSQAPGTISHDKVTVAAGDALPAGQLLTKAADGTYAPFVAADAATAPADAVLYASLPASAGERSATATVRLAEVVQSLLTGYDATAVAGLAAHFIIVR
ncbi:head decoration protein [Paraburkholderia sp. SARCC-3016]|uniref:head decoration protein n=1 Tax=Paraburkholderia sp. SARCC-3016 TaxID=3058611 RepID=UPI00280A25CD|nr:head decoration protein [Paraburkholderia sp. SARCC-3016]MDQ7981356.1 head decoration protein [Paraburkholderia sp. SARCC-3016]